MTYNELGLLNDERVTIAGAAPFVTQLGYDEYQRPKTTTYPDLEVVTIDNYNAMGLPTALSSSHLFGAFAATTLITDTLYDEAGRLQQFVGSTGSQGVDKWIRPPGGGATIAGQPFHPIATSRRSCQPPEILLSQFVMPPPNGGGIKRIQAYAKWGQQDSNGGLLHSIRVEKAGNPLLNLEYNYDSFGNVKTLSDNGSSTAFGYDDQNRLTTGYPLTGTTALTYTYDAAGRLTNYEGAQYRSDAGRHRVSHVDGEMRFGYDANGNIARRSGQNLYWDKENHLESVVGNGVDEQYFYDADGRRVKKIVNGVATFYPSGLVEQTGEVVTKYYFFGGQRVAMRKGGVLTYLHGDHLGSTVLETDSSGNNVGDERFLAFGKKRSGSGVGTDHGFTGQKLDGSGLQYFNARYYDPQLGTFISPDTIVPDPSVAMDFNRYLFVRGNPLKYNDPSGHCIAEGQDGYDTTANSQCQGMAQFIYNWTKNNDSEFITKHFGSVYKTPEEWLAMALSNVAFDANLLSPFFDRAYSASCTSSGLVNQTGCGTYVENPTPPHKMDIEYIAECVNSGTCTTFALNGIGTSSAVVGVACIPAIFACGAGVAAGATIVGVTTGISGLVSTWSNLESTAVDKTVSTVGFVAGLAFIPKPVAGLIVNVVQFGWDVGAAIRSSQPEDKSTKR